MLTDHRGNDQGALSVVLTPCTKKGSPLGDDYFVEDPKELLDKGICLILYLIALLREKVGVDLATRVQLRSHMIWAISYRDKVPRDL